jgi:hypothetical protein
MHRNREMSLDEAIAVYLFLQHRPPGTINDREKAALRDSWGLICKQAEAAIFYNTNSRS